MLSLFSSVGITLQVVQYLDGGAASLPALFFRTKQVWRNEKM